MLEEKATDSNILFISRKFYFYPKRKMRANVKLFNCIWDLQSYFWMNEWQLFYFWSKDPNNKKFVYFLRGKLLRVSPDWPTTLFLETTCEKNFKTLQCNNCQHQVVTLRGLAATQSRYVACELLPWPIDMFRQCSRKLVVGWLVYWSCGQYTRT